MRRREFITLLGGTVAWPLSAPAQQPTPVIGFLNSTSPQAWASFLAAFLQGLKPPGFVDGQNVVIEYRWAESKRPVAKFGGRVGSLSRLGNRHERG